MKNKRNHNPNLPNESPSTRFSSTNQPKNRRKSIRNELRELLEAEGEMVIPEDQVIEVMENGNVKIKLPTRLALAMKLQSLAMSKRGSDALKALNMVIENAEGKLEQTVNHLNDGEAFSIPITKFVSQDDGSPEIAPSESGSTKD